MKAVGLVVEYNPFHNGHAYHVEQSRLASGADVVIAVMSGPFLQRGEPALVSKWARTEMALAAGVDLVIELPAPFASQNAEIFARGSISILEALGCSSFCFGSEDGSIDPFMEAYYFMTKQQSSYDAALRTHLSSGNSYPKAASLAYQELSNGLKLVDLSKPNNILGFEYIKTALHHSFDIIPATIKRIQADYHETQLGAQPIASATGIRKALAEKGSTISTIKQYVPETTAESLNRYIRTYGSLHTWEDYWPLLKYRLLSASSAELAEIAEMEEGIEYRLKSMVLHSTSFQDFMVKIKTKRYTWTRLQRVCVHILTGTYKETTKKLQESPSYLRILGMNDNGRDYLHQIKKHISLPLVSRLASFKEDSIHADIQASTIYTLGLKEPFQSLLLKREYESPVIYRKMV
ncbi:nucleotidyltransferase [Peribacillus psychrosaccharolyticus]|uniref:tRNA(Met) cytidine acetate ligase n=1 Tax=Peribacillus psychrosaccharolyticus TaxID=1407 RepID=A0A974NPD5_PERPY|nr:nucleotidyltransferase [Peribacillus psychrosaccharolyticus]MEC2053683.1 nucleotidyltransferase [Peribacillus psychrosaccharolyticus]MED3742702.1 nucleotidyltransferase [Peribacillus psychrosaccharolyticus]QQT01641.1 nucleotidyltransferase [Peribacillus psychrosaccharolyticus]